MGQLENKVAVVTGASAGIGLAIAQRFAEEGATVYLTGRRQQELDAAVAKVGNGAIGVQGDVSTSEDVERLYAKVSSDGRRVDVVVANAGGGEFVPLEDVTDEHFDRTFGVNVKGTLNTVRKSLGLLNDGASVILVTSMAGSMGQAGLGVYSAAKAAVRSFARTWANELSERGIRVNALAPGSTDTPAVDAALGHMTDEAKRAWQAERLAGVPLRRISQPEEQAGAALFLASKESSYVTGIELIVDGGITQTGPRL